MTDYIEPAKQSEIRDFISRLSVNDIITCANKVRGFTFKAGEHYKVIHFESERHVEVIEIVGKLEISGGPYFIDRACSGFIINKEADPDDNFLDSL